MTRTSSIRKNIFFVHGITDNKNSNPELEELCKELNINFHSIDLPGHGEREFDHNIKLNITSFAQEVINYIKDNDLNHNLILIGHSMGGGIAAHIAANYHKELDVKKLILEDPLNSSVNKNIDHFVLRPFSTLSKINKMKENVNSKENHFIADWLKRVNHDIPLKKWGPMFALGLNIIDKKTSIMLDEDYANLKIPTTIIFGSDDEIVPCNESIENIKKLNPNIAFNIIDKAGHAPHLTKSEEYKNIVKENIK